MQTHLLFLQTEIADKTWGIVAYCVLSVVSLMLPFGSPMALLPLASGLWGWPFAGLLTFFSWLAASALLFGIGRSFGKNLIERIILAERLREMGELLESLSPFNLILLRAVVPSSDMATYALAIFTSMSWKKFLAVTAAGIVVPSFVCAYVGSLSLSVQIGIIVIGCLIVLITLRLRGQLSFGQFRFRQHRSILEVS